MNTRVWILIPCYNAAPFLAATLESTLAQDWPDIAVIVVDDGSTDESLTIARTFEARGVRVISQQNQGASAARNTALRAAGAGWVQFLDADDLLAPDKISVQMACLAKAAPGSVASGEWARFQVDSAEAEFKPEPLWHTMSGVEFQLLKLEHDLMMHPAAWLCPRSLMEVAGSWDETLSLNDDGEYFSRVVLEGAAIVFCPGARSYYRSGFPDSLSGRRGRVALDSWYRSLTLETDRLLARDNSPRARHACAVSFQRLIFDIYPGYRDFVGLANRRIQELGGVDMPRCGGAVFNRLCPFLGWKLLRRLQKMAFRLGYERIMLSKRNRPKRT
jgi:glycosyltransferase involved in cell wall biosynthesis